MVTFTKKEGESVAGRFSVLCVEKRRWKRGDAAAVSERRTALHMRHERREDRRNEWQQTTLIIRAGGFSRKRNDTVRHRCLLVGVVSH